MAYSLHLIADRKLAIISYRGDVSTRDIEGVFDELAALGEAYPGLAAIADFRNCQLTFSTLELRSLASFSQQAAQASGPSKWVILAADDLTFGLGRMFSAFASVHPVETRTFRDVESVADWFNLDPAELEKWLATAAQKAVADRR